MRVFGSESLFKLDVLAVSIVGLYAFAGSGAVEPIWSLAAVFTAVLLGAELRDATHWPDLPEEAKAFFASQAATQPSVVDEETKDKLAA